MIGIIISENDDNCAPPLSSEAESQLKGFRSQYMYQSQSDLWGMGIYEDL